MKEQQRHGCSCAVCGRKRGAIEEELEVLYDAYYDELESYAFHQQRHKSSNGAIPPPPGPGPFPGSVDYNPPPAPVAAPAQTAAQKKSIANSAANKRATPAKTAPPADKKAGNHKHNPSCPHHPHHHHHHGGKCSHNHTPASTQPQSEEEEEESYDEEDEEASEEEEEEYSEGEYEESGSETSPTAPVKTASNGKPVPMPAPHANKQVVPAQPPPKKSAPAIAPAGKGDFFNFTNSLAVKGGILTVADDLLKNDGQKFLEMMESLADKRIQREREAAEHLNFEEDEEDDDEEYDGSFWLALHFCALAESNEQTTKKMKMRKTTRRFVSRWLCMLNAKLRWSNRTRTTKMRKRSSPTINAWKKVVACSKSLPLACLNSVSFKLTERR